MSGTFNQRWQRISQPVARAVLAAWVAVVGVGTASGAEADVAVERPEPAPVLLAKLELGGAGRGEKGARVPSAESRGQFGGDLALLRGFHTAPADGTGESNHYFDLWEPGALAAFARGQGLTNNRALLIDSHGTERFSWKGLQYVLRPNVAAVGAGRKVPTYSMADVAAVMGREAAGRIHNIVLAGCNEAGRLDAAAIRRHFPAATNVVYMSAGHLSYKPQFYQLLTQHSVDIEPLYGREVESAGGRVKSEIFRRPVPGAKRLGRYVAEQFEPGAARSFRRVVAGRELLEPGFRAAADLRAGFIERPSAEMAEAAVEAAGTGEAQGSTAEDDLGRLDLESR